MPDTGGEPVAPSPHRTWPPMVGWTLGILAALGLTWSAGLIVIRHLEAGRIDAAIRQVSSRESGSLLYIYGVEGDQAIQQLGGEERAVASLSRYLRAPGKSAWDRNSAILILAHCGEPAVPVLVRALTDDDTRRVAAVSLGEMGPIAREAIPALEALRKDPHEPVRQSAVQALAKIRGDVPVGR